METGKPLLVSPRPSKTISKFERLGIPLTKFTLNRDEVKFSMAMRKANKQLTFRTPTKSESGFHRFVLELKRHNC